MQLDEAAISNFAGELDPSAVQASAVYVRLPIRFDSMQAEVCQPCCPLTLSTPFCMLKHTYTQHNLHQHNTHTQTYQKRLQQLLLQVNYLVLFHLLDFGSGFDSLLLQKARRDAHEVRRHPLVAALATATTAPHAVLCCAVLCCAVLGVERRGMHGPLARWRQRSGETLGPSPCAMPPEPSSIH